jgi:hypothetical protein
MGQYYHIIIVEDKGVREVEGEGGIREGGR